jgi:serine/threonine-protein kinase HipA
MSNLNIEVKLYGNIVGYLAQDNNDNVFFEYEDTFKALGLEISPLKLKTKETTIYRNRDDNFFQGLPGVIHDSLPDKFGNSIIEKYYNDKGIPNYKLSILQKLSYIGNSGMGALEFYPDNINNTSTLEILKIQHLVKEARDIITGKSQSAIPELMESGASAGGARAKAIISWNREKNIVKSGRLDCEEGFEQYLIKFDGVGETGKSEDYIKIEYIYMTIARELGLNVSNVELIKERELSHLLVKRFDRVDNRKIHMHSLCGMTHTNFSDSGLYSYEKYVHNVYNITMDINQTHKAILHMLFNIVSRNQDDHTKNFSFLMNEHGNWSTSPIYDLTYSYGSGYTRSHQMTLNSKRDNFKREDILQLSRKYSLSDEDVTNIIIIFVAKFKALFYQYAIEQNISTDKIERVLANCRSLES